MKAGRTPRILSLELEPVGNATLQGRVQVQFTEFLQRDCQDVMIEDDRAGALRFLLNLTNGEIEFTAESYPVREYDPEEFWRSSAILQD